MNRKSIVIQKDIVSAMFDKARPVVVYDNKDYFLKDIFQAFKGTDAGQQISAKVNSITDPILDNALDKAVIKFRGELTPLLVILILVLISNLVTIFKN